jgi:glyoxylase I family protein
VTLAPTDYGQLPRQQKAGPTAFKPFTRNTEYFGRSEQAWMINFRVRDLAAMVNQLEASGLEGTVDSRYLA